jgi:UDP-glucose 4-epimerase
MSQILVTGGAGYIGSHTTLVLLEAGYDVIVLDNLENSSPQSLARVQTITKKPIELVVGDVRDKKLLEKVFKKHSIDTVLHFAGLKSVSESVVLPLNYYSGNVEGTMTVCQAMLNHGTERIVFSSSCTVYGSVNESPISEKQSHLKPTNPYGNSKLAAERLLSDIAGAQPSWEVGVLRYFNPLGAHQSGLIGEDPKSVPANLVPYITQVAIGKLDQLNVFGDDYDTPDGTGIRDYIHVMDLAEGHLSAMRTITGNKGVHTWNLGTGRGFSVLEVINTFEMVSGKSIPYSIKQRRAGDIEKIFANPSKANMEMKWAAKLTLQQMLQDAWRWQSMNPEGFES